MDAKPWLLEVGRALQKVDLEAVLIGNAAAALQGAPVTTIDLDFMFRKTPGNLRKLRRLADELEAQVLRPFYPLSNLFRIVRDDDGLQIDFMPTIHGIRSFEGLRDRAVLVDVDGVPLRVATLADIIKSKKAAGRPRDRAVMDVLERAREEEEAKSQTGARRARPRK